MVALKLNEAKSEPEPVQDIQFLRLRLRLEIIAYVCQISSQTVCRTEKCPISWNHEVDHDQVGLRSHPTDSTTHEALTTTLGLTDRFTPPC